MNCDCERGRGGIEDGGRCEAAEADDRLLEGTAADEVEDINEGAAANVVVDGAKGDAGDCKVNEIGE